ncbi:uncharacterized protein CTHT_0053270 [Thermochaetoides thermophila DSM 1495]|uniref:Integral membrane protein n=1 Tax=Chaetomium thermophilum (strain DSM 1495 / CBS 144.50 / IMI 039719) TaxID=759272 RepID=G0SDW8_CHATD|nr:hypothetical protein CTHT_0053270 [Thermochaetoides thermophila DSM 1495]EGS18719.1 hypothetical protein CTHT_0053270 [Thermochaetoides thermophila DSM 1495]
MANPGRFLCIALPFLLTLASLISMLVAGLAGVADKKLYMFRINTTDLEISPLNVQNILNQAGVNIPNNVNLDNINIPNNVNLDNINIPNVKIDIDKRQSQSKNITAADLGLHNLYDISIFTYCYTDQSGDRHCPKPAFNWARSALNTTPGDFNSLITTTGLNVTLPEEITSAIRVFTTVSRWTQYIYIAAIGALVVELFFGLFANCSRAMSCVTFLVAGVAAVLVGTAAAMATATAATVVGAVEASAKYYGVDSKINTRFLSAVWFAFTFAAAAALFWCFTICCCKPDRYKSAGGGVRHRDESASEKFIPLASGAGASAKGYQRLSEASLGENGNTGYYGAGGYSAGYPRQYPEPVAYGAQRESAYEPYSHVRT